MVRKVENATAVEVLRDVVHLKKGGEVRVQQEEMVENIEDAIKNGEHIIVEAPTGAGKSIGNLIPIIVSEKKAVISTATKQLSEQIIDKEIPFVQEALLKTHPGLYIKDFTILKGRENYLCKKKEHDLAELSSRENIAAGNQLGMFDDDESSSTTTKISDAGAEFARESKLLDGWSETTKTGDRSDAPPVSDKTWKGYSSTTLECPGKSKCRFGKECFAEQARDFAAEAQIVVTNHAVVGHALNSTTPNFLDDREIVVFDEIHELSNYLTSAWGATITMKRVSDTLKDLRKSKTVDERTLKSLDDNIFGAEKFFATAENGLIENMPLAFKENLRNIHTGFTKIATNLEKKSREESGSKKEEYGALQKRAQEIADQIVLVITDEEETVVWFTVPEANPYQRKGAAKKVVDNTVYLNAAPLRIGPKLQQTLEDKELLMVGTSATIRVGGKFDIPIHNLGLDNKPHKAIALDTPFDFQKQGMIYIPNSDFPSPVGSERKEHTEASKQETLELVMAAGGRALVLTTTTYDCDEMAKFLAMKLKGKKIKVLRQGDAPQKQLVEEFEGDETSVLVATMGMWHGLDVQGPSLSLVVITKIPFKPMNDPLLVARQKHAEANGRNGFNDVYVADANVMLSQGVGRLIRHTADRGVCAILDQRLLSKAYGKKMLESLPHMKIFTNKMIVLGALQRLTAKK